MADLKVYRWEANLYPREQKIYIAPRYRVPLTKKLCERFGLKVPVVDERRRGHSAGSANSWRISLPLPTYRCALSTILHEVAHTYDYQINKHLGHTKTFKRSLIKIFVESRGMLAQAVREIRIEHIRQDEINHKYLNQQLRKAEQKADLKAKKQTAEWKIQHLEQRIKRLNTKRKRIETLLKSAQRSLVAYLRQQQLKQERARISV